MCVFLFLCVFAGGDVEVKVELGEETGLVEEDLVAMPYTGDELDMETVGDIIAIIEEKVQILSYGRGFTLLYLCPHHEMQVLARFEYAVSVDLP